ncbi:MAG: hypothetical protein ACPHFO_01480 [Acidimicrobiales bacterium]|jgi:hypothetical protein
MPIAHRAMLSIRGHNHPNCILADRASVSDSIAYLDACVGMITKASA